MIDPSIPLSVRPPEINSPMQTQAIIGQQRDQQQTQQIRALQIQEHQQKVETNRAEQVKTKRIKALFEGPTPPTEARIMSEMGPEDGIKMIRGLAALQTDNQKQYASQQELIRDVLAGMDALPEGVRAEYYPAIRKNLLDRSLITDQDAPETYDPQWFQQVRNFGRDQPKPAEPYTLSPGSSRFGADNQPVASVPAKPADAPNVGSFEDYLTRYASQRRLKPEQLSTGDIEQARKAYGQADDRAITVKTGGDARGLTPNMESQVINRLANQWTAASKPARELERQVSIMDAGITAARRGELAQGAQAVLVTFQKILDPTSVVRESEFDRSAAGQSLMNRARGAMERLAVGGAGVPLPELEKFATLAKEIATAQRGSRLEAIKERVGKVADRYKLPRELVFESDTATNAPADKAGRQRVKGPNGETGTVPAGSPLPDGWVIQ